MPTSLEIEAKAAALVQAAADRKAAASQAAKEKAAKAKATRLESLKAQQAAQVKRLKAARNTCPVDTDENSIPKPAIETYEAACERLKAADWSVKKDFMRAAHSGERFRYSLRHLQRIHTNCEFQKINGKIAFIPASQIDNLNFVPYTFLDEDAVMALVAITEGVESVKGKWVTSKPAFNSVNLAKVAAARLIEEVRLAALEDADRALDEYSTIIRPYHLVMLAEGMAPPPELFDGFTKLFDFFYRFIVNRATYGFKPIELGTMTVDYMPSILDNLGSLVPVPTGQSNVVTKYRMNTKDLSSYVGFKFYGKGQSKTISKFMEIVVAAMCDVKRDDKTVRAYLRQLATHNLMSPPLLKGSSCGGFADALYVPASDIEFLFKDFLTPEVYRTLRDSVVS
jgi:hypothetical protein